MKPSTFNIRKIKNDDKQYISEFMTDHWGSLLSVSKGNVHNVSELPGFICYKHHKIAGLITYYMNHDECEIVTLNSLLNNLGLGSQLIGKVVQVARKNECKQLWLITTNDNSRAIRFYQKRGFEWTGFYRNAMNASRKLKPEIPLNGFDNIPIKHELEFTLFL